MEVRGEGAGRRSCSVPILGPEDMKRLVRINLFIDLLYVNER